MRVGKYQEEEGPSLNRSIPLGDENAINNSITSVSAITSLQKQKREAVIHTTPRLEEAVPLHRHLALPHPSSGFGLDCCLCLKPEDRLGSLNPGTCSSPQDTLEKTLCSTTAPLFHWLTGVGDWVQPIDAMELEHLP